MELTPYDKWLMEHFEKEDSIFNSLCMAAKGKDCNSCKHEYICLALMKKVSDKRELSVSKKDEQSNNRTKESQKIKVS